MCNATPFFLVFYVFFSFPTSLFPPFPSLPVISVGHGFHTTKKFVRDPSPTVRRNLKFFLENSPELSRDIEYENSFGPTFESRRKYHSRVRTLCHSSFHLFFSLSLSLLLFFVFPQNYVTPLSSCFYYHTNEILLKYFSRWRMEIENREIFYSDKNIGYIPVTKYLWTRNLTDQVRAGRPRYSFKDLGVEEESLAR